MTANAHVFHPSFLREYDCRGVVGTTLFAADAVALGRAFGTRVRRAGGSKVAVGYDGRLSSPDLETALVEGLRSTGVHVHRIGLGATPMLYFAVVDGQLDGGIQITGSHNPPDYNGFKMMLGQAPFFGADIQDLGRIAAAGDFETGSALAHPFPVFARYIDRLAEEPIGGRPLTVAWDPGNGAAGPAVEDLVKRLPGRHLVINGAIDGTFPNHHPDPTVPKNLVQLQELVAREGADLGIAFDGDGDRIGVIDAQGRILWGDQLVALLARPVLAANPGATIIADVKASQVLFDEISRLGGTPLMWKTGHSLIKAKMKEVKSPLAGEMSGHIFFADRWYGFDDAIYAALRVLAVVAAGDESLAALRESLPETVSTPELRFPCDEERKFGVVQEVAAALTAAGARMATVDGVRVLTEDGWWLLRASNTQAVLVARAESQSAEGLARLTAALEAALGAVGVALPEDAAAGH